MGWSLLIGAEGAALSEYKRIADMVFFEELYDYGAATIVLGGLGGNAVPAVGNVLKIVWDRGLSSEQVHWFGYITAAQKKQQGSVYVIRAYTLDAKLFIKQTGVYRNYVAKTPYAIMQTAGTPNPLLVDAQGNTVMTYGSAAGVPNKVETTSDRMGSFSGTVANDQFVADSTSLFNNMRRLCLQARYTNDAAPDGSSDGDLDGSYGLEWTTTLEGANLSSPRFYLVKRRERSSGYAPEVYNIPSDFQDARRGTDQAPGLDAVRVVGAGDGVSRIASAIIGAGTRELTAEDKAIFQATNATNLANRLLGIYATSIEVIMTGCYRHASPTRAGDTITVTQTGVANMDLRVMMRAYDLQSKSFTFLIGRPTPYGKDLESGINAALNSDTTTPQYTDKQSVAGDEPIAVNGTRTAVTAGNGVFGAWTTIHSFTPAASFDIDYIDGTLTYYNNAANAHDADLEFRVLRNSDSVQFGTTFAGSADGPTPQDAMDTVAVVTQLIIPINAILAAVQYNIQVRAKDTGGVGGFTDDFRLVGKIMKQHRHSEDL